MTDSPQSLIETLKAALMELNPGDPELMEKNAFNKGIQIAVSIVRKHQAQQTAPVCIHSAEDANKPSGYRVTAQTECAHIWGKAGAEGEVWDGLKQCTRCKAIQLEKATYKAVVGGRSEYSVMEEVQSQSPSQEQMVAKRSDTAASSANSCEIPLLKQCPFCGSAHISSGQVVVTSVDGRDYVQTTCLDCGANGPYSPNDKAANMGWNTRSIEPVATGEISVVDDAALEIAEKAYNDWCDETEEIAGEPYCHEVPLRVAIDAYLRSSDAQLYSLLQWQAQEITRLRLRKPKPVSVSLESMKLTLRSQLGPYWEERAKTVLDAAGVPYVD